MERIVFLGFGEAAQAFAGARPAGAPPSYAYDIKTDRPETRAAKHADYARSGISGHDDAAVALDGADVILSLVTADQALPATMRNAGHLTPGALWLDMNSVAPDTKRAAAAAIEAAGGRYVDVAVLAPVHPRRLAVPVIVAGPHAEAATDAMRRIGFETVGIVAGAIGAASAIKMIRSVMVKGLEALTAECALAAEAAGVRREVFASLDASWPGTDWAAHADYNLDRMMVHGLRRAAEMEEVVKTLDALGTGSAMARATAERQRAIGRLSIAPPEGLTAKLATLVQPFSRSHAA